MLAKIKSGSYRSVVAVDVTEFNKTAYKDTEREFSFPIPALRVSFMQVAKSPVWEAGNDKTDNWFFTNQLGVHGIAVRESATVDTYLYMGYGIQDLEQAVKTGVLDLSEVEYRHQQATQRGLEAYSPV